MDTLHYLEQYRQVKTLKSGTRVLMRPLTPDDAEALVTLFDTATPEDMQYMRHDVADRDVVMRWATEADLLDTFPLVAEVNGRLVGDATLHFGAAYRRHLCWLRIFLAPEFRRQGIGSLMLENLVAIARRRGMHQIIAEVLSIQVQMRKALESLHFVREYCHEDYFMAANGETLDMDTYILRLIVPGGQF